LLTSAPTSHKLAQQLANVTDLQGLSWIHVDEVADDEAADYEVMTPDPYDLCYLQYTSGSTGEPRGVMVSHHNLIAQSLYLQRTFGFGPNDRGLNWLPLYHDLGLVLGVLQPLFSGFPLAQTDPLSFIKYPDRWLRAISEHGITFAGGPNFCFDLCLDLVDPSTLDGVDLSRWRMALNGSEPVRSRTMERFAARFSTLGWKRSTMHPAYGLAEFTLVATSKPPGTLPVEKDIDADALTRGEVQSALPTKRSVRAVSSGRIGPGTTVRIVDPESGIAVEPGRVGEIWVAGPCVTMGYWNRGEESEATFHARLSGDSRNYLRTGDLGFVDEGELFITGRKKDLIVVRGVNHYPQDIEQTVELADTAIRPHFVAAFSV
jgi:acyl-CoA synthetase (AMP-forming)/AMP-acid ligase II